jgi:CDP-diacylglycerol--glycerol-3-phosphate 3-phosphatidyltransferase/cardiolipin synthase
VPATLNLPNTLTWIRIALIPMFAVVFWLPYDWARPASAVIFSLAGITDWLDGYFARRLNQVSAFGTFLDPVADKLMVSTALVLLVSAHPRVTLALAAAVIIGREIAVSGLREWMAELGARDHVAVSPVGKFKTIAQITALIMMLYEHDFWVFPMFDLGYGLLLAAAVLTLWSMTRYLMSSWPHLRGR